MDRCPPLTFHMSMKFVNASFPPEVTKALDRFNHLVDEIESEAARKTREDEEIRQSKSLKLMPLRMLLKQLMDMNLLVRNSTYNNPDAAPQPLVMNEEPSSPSYAPGTSLRLDHPGVLEIAIPNGPDIERLGIVVINCAKKHPHANLFESPFRTMDSACAALAEFIALNTLARKNRPSSVL
jgi:hypothetical protein